MAEKKQESLTPEDRAIRVLASQGLAPMRYASYPVETQAKIEELCDDQGQLDPQVRAKFAALMSEYFASQKSVVDTVEVKGEKTTTATTVGNADGTLVPDWKPKTSE